MRSYISMDYGAHLSLANTSDGTTVYYRLFGAHHYSLVRGFYRCRYGVKSVIARVRIHIQVAG